MYSKAPGNQTDDKCYRCKKPREDARHLFWQCDEQEIAQERKKWLPKILAIARTIKHIDIMQYGPFLNCGLMPENKNIWKAEWDLARTDDHVSTEIDSTQQ